MRFKNKILTLGMIGVLTGGFSVNAYAESTFDTSRQTIWSALLGAGMGAIAAEASGGKAGTGALVGAGTNIIGGALVDLLVTPQSQTQPTTYYYSQPQPQTVYQQPQVVTYQPVQTVPDTTTYYTQTTPVYTNVVPKNNNQTQQLVKEGLIGAATGAIASEASDGNAGTGALVGAGTHIIGSALIDILFQPQSTKQPTTYTSFPTSAVSPVTYNKAPAPQKKVIRTYDSEGNLISEEEFVL